MKNKFLSIALALAVLTGLVGFSRAQFGSEQPVVIQNVETMNLTVGSAGSSGQSDSFGAFISSGTHLTDLAIANDLEVTGASTLTGTTTLSQISKGSPFVETLSFTAGNTTTPGAVGSIQWTGAPLICNGIPKVLLTSQIEGSMDFSIATSTQATAFSGSGFGLGATTTHATGTAGFINFNPGSYFGNNLTTNRATSTAPWRLTNGLYLHLTMDAQDTRDNATTTDYSTAAGKMYLDDCYTQ